MIKIERQINHGECYFCHRTLEEINGIIDPDSIQNEVTDFINGEIESRQRLLQDYRKYLIKLYTDTADYVDMPIENALFDLPSLKSMMPRLDELLKIRHLTLSNNREKGSKKRKKPALTLKEIRNTIYGLYEQLLTDQIPNELEHYNKELYLSLTSQISPNLRNSSFILPARLKFSQLPLIMYTDLNGEHIRKAVNRKYYYDYNFDGNRLLEDAKPVEKANIIQISLIVSVCGICKNSHRLFKGEAI